MNHIRLPVRQSATATRRSRVVLKLVTKLVEAADCDAHRCMWSQALSAFPGLSPILVAGHTVVGLELGALVREIIFSFGLSGELVGPTKAEPDFECGVVCVEVPDHVEALAIVIALH